MTDQPRQPRKVAPARIAPLASLPVFHKLNGRFVVLAGQGEGAMWKAELLAAAGAEIRLFATTTPDAMAAHDCLRWQGRDWQPDDMVGAALAIGAMDSDEDATAFAAAARAAGVPVNVIDRPGFCDFQFGAIVNRSPLVIGISTDGAAPVFGQAIRARIEALLPAGLARWAQAAKDWRRFVQASRPDFALRRKFWERFTARALAEPDRQPDATDRRDLLRAFARDRRVQEPGRVSLVGAGPGDPDLLTIKALRALQSADVILHDDLVTPAILELARREAVRIAVGKRGHGPSCAQEEISALIRREAQAGRRVVRLKGGDPLIFGRATEEIEACRAAGIPVEIIPGISAAQGAGAALGISLTERAVARRLQYLTIHDETGALPADTNWPAIADPGATTVLYMPRHRIGSFVEQAITAGLPADMPAMAVSRVSRPDEARLAAPLAALPGRLAASGEAGPTLIVVGAVLRKSPFWHGKEFLLPMAAE